MRKICNWSQESKASVYCYPIISLANCLVCPSVPLLVCYSVGVVLSSLEQLLVACVVFY